MPILLVKDVPPSLPLNISGMEQGWILYHCDCVAEQPASQHDDPCRLVNMNKVQRLYDLAQHALGWQQQRIAGWRLAARVDDDALVSVRDIAWRFSEFLVVEDDDTLTLPQVEGATLVYAAVYGESPSPSPPPPPPLPPSPPPPPPPQQQQQHLQQQQPTTQPLVVYMPATQPLVATPPPSPQP